MLIKRAVDDSIALFIVHDYDTTRVNGLSRLARSFDPLSEHSLDAIPWLLQFHHFDYTDVSMLVWQGTHPGGCMDLLPAALRATLPALYSQENIPDPIIHVKFFTPDSNWTWFVSEGDAEADDDYRFFGYVVGFESEWGYFLLSELQSARGPLKLRIERDLYFKPKPFSEAVKT